MRLYLIRHGGNAAACASKCGSERGGLPPGQLWWGKGFSVRIYRRCIPATFCGQWRRPRLPIFTGMWSIWCALSCREISFGDMEGLTDEEIARRFADFKAEQSRMEEDIPYPGGECAGDVIRRAEPVFMEMAASGFERVAVVTHGGVIRAMTAHYLGIPPAKWRLLGKDLENCSITELLWNEKQKRFTVERFNDYAHLEPYPELLRRSWTNASN